MSIDLSRFLQTFYEESYEGLDIMESGLLKLESGAADLEVVNDIFRAAHSIKGGSGMFSLTAVTAFTHVMETLLDEMRNSGRMVTPQLVEMLLNSVDCLRDMLQAGQLGSEFDPQRVADQQRQLEEALGTDTGQTQPDPAEADEVATTRIWRIGFSPAPGMLQTGNDPLRLIRELGQLGQVRLKADTSGLPPFAELDSESCYLAWEISLQGEATEAQIREVFSWVEGDCELTIQPDEAMPERRAGSDRRDENRTDRRRGDRRDVSNARPQSSSIRVSTDKVDALVNMVGELVITQAMLSQLGDSVELENEEQFKVGLAQLERNTRELQEGIMGIRLLPISFAFQRFPRVVHDLSTQLDKQVRLSLSGESTELDKTVLEKIGDPLMHLVRNAVDHGIESADDRRAAGKDPEGVIHLDAFHRGGNIVIEIKDDGAGINRDRVLDKARRQGLIKADESLADEAVFDLLFQPGFSTAAEVSDVSGRGVGMDVVRKNIQSLGGNVTVTSQPGQGSTFSIRLPLTLAILDGQLVRVGHETYITPLVSIVESLQVKDDQVNELAGGGHLYRLRDEYIPIIRLHEVFAVTADSHELCDGLVVVVESGGKKVGMFVDELLGQQQVVIKSLEVNYKRVEGISGATILGDGKVALILDVDGLIKFWKTGSNSNYGPQLVSSAA
ncbi:MAG: chemotaxis protein CheA [Gammaproteobacteria bacterium]|nr:chemotaxis protein CheA [Gammaproteobacteria bacterium]